LAGHGWKNLLLVAQNHDHSAAVTPKAYAKRLAGATDKDVTKTSADLPLADWRNA
jgi:hypothetical protein